MLIQRKQEFTENSIPEPLMQDTEALFGYNEIEGNRFCAVSW